MFPHDSDSSTQYVSTIKNGNLLAYATVYDIEPHSFYIKGLENTPYSHTISLLNQIIDSSNDSIFYLLDKHYPVLEKALIRCGFSLLFEDNNSILYKFTR